LPGHDQFECFAGLIAGQVLAAGELEQDIAECGHGSSLDVPPARIAQSCAVTIDAADRIKTESGEKLTGHAGHYSS
jgi:hypothetical protein